MEKTVLITGCSSGFGKALCEEFKKEHYYVIATARKPEQIDTPAADLKVQLDVSDEDSIRRALSLILTKVKTIDVLINNAGYSVRSAVEEINIFAMQNMMDVNVFGMIRMMQQVIPIMRKHGGGRIYNIGSISGRMTGIANGGYCASKYAVEALTEAARYETQDMGIEICVIEPGAMDTGFFKTLSKNSDEKMHNPMSAYKNIYERDLTYRAKQSRSNVFACAEKVVRINRSKRLKVRYTVGVSIIFRIFVKCPDCIKEWGIRHFN